MDYYVHPSAIIDEGCSIGSGTRIWHFCHVMPGAVIGNNCILGQNVFVAANVVLGNNVKVQNNVSLYEGVICGDDVFIGPSAVFTNVINPRSAVNRKDQYRQTFIRNGASVGANATIICGSIIGSYAMVGAGAVVTKNVPDYAVVAGNPAIQRGWISEDGQPLAFDENGNSTCTGDGQRYKLLNNQVHKVK